MEAIANSSVGMRELKENLAQFVERAEHGEIVTITRNGSVVAKLVPSRNAEPQTWEEAEKILEARFGGKLKKVDWSKIRPPADVEWFGPTMSELIIEERRNARF